MSMLFRDRQFEYSVSGGLIPCSNLHRPADWSSYGYNTCKIDESSHDGVDNHRQHHHNQRDQHALPENKRKRKEKTEKEKREREQKLVDAVKSRSISAPEFLAALKKKKKDKYLNIEVRAIVQNQEEYACTVAFKPENVSHNNHPDIVTYDHSRVSLQSLPDGVVTDYINASFIEGCGGIPNEYIAAQGPNHKHKESVIVFWQMIWEQGVHCIVMTCSLFEHAVQQCAKYWEDMFGKLKNVVYGDVEIQLEDTECFMHMTVRTLSVQKKGHPPRTVRQFELSGWGDQDEPDAGLIVEYRRRIRLFTDSTTGPMLVHGRYGGGRTAVFIAVDYCLKQLEMDNSVDIYSTVLHLRKFRKNMVRTLAQYRTIYETVGSFINSGHTVIPCSHLPAVVQRLSIKDPRVNMTGIEQEYKNLEKIIKRIELGECAAGHQVQNRNKSRDIMLQPPERSRPCLQTGESVEDTDYINAVYVDGYQTVNSFIVTQWPYKNTVKDVWRLLYDQRIDTLVVLNDVKHCRSYPSFWPKKVGGSSEQRFGPIGVRYINCIKYPHVVIRVFQIRKLPRQKITKSRDVGNLIQNAVKLAAMSPKGNSNPIQWRYVKMFQIRSDSWPSKEKVPSAIDPLVYLMNFVEEWQENNSVMKSPICVMSKDGVSRCGLYCALSVNCSKLQKEGDVDVYNSVRMIKRNRPPLVSCPEYSYCYMFLSRFVELLQEHPPQIIVSGASQVYMNSAFEAPEIAQAEENEGTGLLSRRSSAASFRTAVEDANELAKIYSSSSHDKYFMVSAETASVVIEDERAEPMAPPPTIVPSDDEEEEEFVPPETSSVLTQTAALPHATYGKATDRQGASSSALTTRPHQYTATPYPHGSSLPSLLLPTGTQGLLGSRGGDVNGSGSNLGIAQGTDNEDTDSVITMVKGKSHEPSLASSYTTAVPRLGADRTKLGGSRMSLESEEDLTDRVEMSKLVGVKAPLADEEPDEIITPF
ncbi:receptor-type tyrosine-protein phosphatase kappa-like isoform X2 [Liolophura sinensis]|uniref:receptor-type tyrosine-protein phosphatase kappa-like isoform X2 n=1 Tax=Liolophura sinensis TaxID=3198878 RepID=UPI00315982A7